MILINFSNDGDKNNDEFFGLDEDFDVMPDIGDGKKLNFKLSELNKKKDAFKKVDSNSVKNTGLEKEVKNKKKGGRGN